MRTLSKPYQRDAERVEASSVARKFLRRPDVQKKTGLSRSTLYRLVALGEFPAPARLSPRTSAWLESEVDAYCERAAAARACKLVA